VDEIALPWMLGKANKLIRSASTTIIENDLGRYLFIAFSLFRFIYCDCSRELPGRRNARVLNLLQYRFYYIQEENSIIP
jgi:hypothetical protein